MKRMLYRNFEANILSSKHWLHKFRNLNLSSDIIIGKIGSKKTQICVSCVKGDTGIKVIPK